MIPQEDIEYWQSAWSQLLDMTFYRKNVVDSLIMKRDIDPSWKNDDDFEKLTFDYMWKKYSKERDSSDKPLDVTGVPELKNLCIPHVLFSCLGSTAFLKTCFPRCEVTYW